MEFINNIINPLIDKIETLGHTQLEIYKYRIMLKTSTLFASLIFLFILVFFLLLMSISLNIAIAHWIGGVIGNIVLGYIIVSCIHALIALFIYLNRGSIRNRIQDKILNHIQI